jgi:hypothetical protein
LGLDRKVCGSSLINAGEARPWGAGCLLLLMNPPASNSSFGDPASLEECKREAFLVDKALFGRVLVFCELLSSNKRSERAQSIVNMYRRKGSSREPTGRLVNGTYGSSKMVISL